MITDKLSTSEIREKYSRRRKMICVPYSDVLNLLQPVVNEKVVFMFFHLLPATVKVISVHVEHALDCLAWVVEDNSFEELGPGQAMPREILHWQLIELERKAPPVPEDPAQAKLGLD